MSGGSGLYTGIDVLHEIPSEFIMREPSSVAKTIIKRDLLRIPAFNPPNYGASFTPYTSFKVSSPQDLLDLQNSYFEIQLEANQTCSMSEIGVHALFSRIEVRGLGNIQIQEQDQYHLWAGIYQKNMMTTEERRMESQMIGQQEIFDEPALIDLGTAVWTNADKLLTFTDNGSVAKVRAQNIKANDWVLISRIAGETPAGSATAQIADLEYTASASSATIQLDVANTGLAVNGATYNVVLLRINDNAVMEANQSYRFLFKPRMAFFERLWELFLSKSGYEFKFYYNPNYIPLQANDAAVVSTPVIKVTDFTFWANFITPHPDVIAEYAKQWQTPKGIQKYLPSVAVQQKSTTTVEGSETFTFQFGGKRAAQQLLCIFQSAPSQTHQSVSTNAQDCVIFPSTGVNSFQARVGSYVFPSEPVQDDDGSNLSYRHVRMTKHLLMGLGNRLGAQIARAQNLCRGVIITEDTIMGNPDNFVILIDFARYHGPGQELTGVDVSTVPIDVTIGREDDFENDEGALIFYGFLMYDAYLKMSSTSLAKLE